MPAIVMELIRGPLVESLFRGDAAVVDSTGRVLFQVGDGRKVTFWRSSAKPVQALPVITSGAADAFGFTDEHLAIFCASHQGEPVHTETVADALRRAGLSPDYLQCGAHAPYDRATARELEERGERPRPVHSNCSGKHTGMLAIGRHLGLPLDDYLSPSSAVQQVVIGAVARVCGLPKEQIALGVDGCGVPVFGMDLAHMSLAFARLADPDRMPEGFAGAGRRIRDAMIAHPYLVAGGGRICTDLMGLPGGRLVAKSGAEGVYSIGVLPDAVAASPALQRAGAVGGIGITVKVEDGNADARHLMTVEILRQLDLLTEEDLAALAKYRPAPIKNWAGRVVGEKRIAFTLQPVEGVFVG
ncbi:MAG: asparaginase [Bacillota bacterium]